MPDPAALLDGPTAERIFDELEDVVFFIKDAKGRYTAVNQALADRCAGGDKSRLVGKTPAQVFPPGLAEGFADQDRRVISSGRGVERQLELHLYPGRVPGWCLTSKHPLRAPDGRITGVVGISRDLDAPSSSSPAFGKVAVAIEFMRQHHAQGLRIGELARCHGLSARQFAQQVRRLYHMTPLQLLHKFRLDEAARLLLETSLPLGEIALRTGWCDQSAFTRYFTRYAAIAPGRFRTLARTTPHTAQP